MKEIVTIFQNYCGSGWYPVLFLAALLYLLVTEKKKQIRVVLVESSLVITVLFFLPFTKTIMNLLGEGETYYRILWLLPMAVVIAYAGIRLFGKHYRIGFVVLALVLVLIAGVLVFVNSINDNLREDRKIGVQQPVSVKGAEPVSYSKFRDCDLQRDHAGGGGRARLGGISAGADLLCAAVYLGGADALRAGNAGGVLGVELGHASDL